MMNKTTFNGYLLNGSTFQSREDLRPRESRPGELGGSDGLGGYIRTVTSDDGHFDVHEDDDGKLYASICTNHARLHIGLEEVDGVDNGLREYRMIIPPHLETHHFPGCMSEPGYLLDNGGNFPSGHWEAPSDYSRSAKYLKAARNAEG